LAALVLQACGEDEPESAATVAPAAPVALTPAEAQVITATDRAIGRYCGAVARSLARGGGPPPAEDFDRVSQAIERLGALAAERPDASAPSGQSPRLALGDFHENVESSNCDNRLVTVIEAELAELPGE